MDEQKLKSIIADNLVFYRKAAKLTQLEVANLICYSDKSVSKWERGDGIPDISVLVMLADLYKISLNDFVTEKKRNPPVKLNKLVLSLIWSGVVWLVAAIVYFFLAIFLPDDITFKLWKIFIYAIPICGIVLCVFSCLWGNKYHIFSSASLLVWGAGLSVYLSIVYKSNAAITVFGICIVLQIIAVLWLFLKPSFFKNLIKESNDKRIAKKKRKSDANAENNNLKTN